MLAPGEVASTLKQSTFAEAHEVVRDHFQHTRSHCLLASHTSQAPGSMQPDTGCRTTTRARQRACGGVNLPSGNEQAVAVPHLLQAKSICTTSGRMPDTRTTVPRTETSRPASRRVSTLGFIVAVTAGRAPAKCSRVSGALARRARRRPGHHRAARPARADRQGAPALPHANPAVQWQGEQIHGLMSPTGVRSPPEQAS